MKTEVILALPGAITATSIELPLSLTQEQWTQIVHGLRNVRESSLFYLGDALLFGEARYGQEFSQSLGEDYREKTLQNAMYVCRNVSPAVRRDDLTYSHHSEVASLPQPAQVAALQMASQRSMSVRELRAWVGRDRIPVVRQREPRIESKKLRAASKGENCVRCGGADAVPAHYCGVEADRLGKGMGEKAHDIAIADLCDRCHKEFDSYSGVNDYERGFEFLLLCLLTLARRVRSGVIKLP